jgi:gluconolactonase
MIISYAFDLMEIAGQPFLANRRLFAFTEGRAPDGIKCDMDGNVYCGCLDGINIWSGGVANFCFCRAGEIMAMNEYHLWKIKLVDTTVGALLRNGSKETEESM